MIIPSLIAAALTFAAPEQMAQAGHVYKQAYQQKANNGRAIYEYTDNNESVQNWTRLVTLNYTPQLRVDAQTWANATRKALDANPAKPAHQLDVKGANAYAQMVFEPDAANPEYEANVQKSFHVADCGTVILQYAVKYPKGSDLTTIQAENARIAVQLEQDTWQPACQ